MSDETPTAESIIGTVVGEMTSDEQLDLWVAGTSVHDTDSDQCCPDFSCCNSKMNTPEHERRAFLEGNEDTRHQMLMVFLERALAGEAVHLAGQMDKRTQHDH